MVVNFRTRGISRGARKLTQTPTLIIIKKKIMQATSRDRLWKRDHVCSGVLIDMDKLSKTS
jgi:hypothetical protein